MIVKRTFDHLPKSFRSEEKALLAKGINNWDSLMNLNTKEMVDLTKSGRTTLRNLKRLQCIAIFICRLNLLQEEASLLIHSGIASLEALRKLSPQELLIKTGRLERMLNIGRDPLVTLEKANNWIRAANQAKKELT
tara:strand:- start:269 stop:676 length:408 start_codon:yes stop_codon:yes gene_type:complete